MFENGLSGSISADLTRTDTSVPSVGNLDDNRENLIFSLSYPLMKNRSGRSLNYPIEIANLSENISRLQYDHLIEELDK